MKRDNHARVSLRVYDGPSLLDESPVVMILTGVGRRETREIRRDAYIPPHRPVAVRVTEIAS